MKMPTETTVDVFLEQLKKYGDHNLYLKIVEGWLTILPASAKSTENMENQVLGLSDCFFSMFRRTGIKEHFILGKVFRRAAHTIYRESLKRDGEKVPNFTKFLNLISSTEDTDGYQRNNN